MESSIPYLKAALKTLLEADSDLSGVQVTHGNPKQYPPKAVVIGSVTPEPLAYVAGRSQATEKYDLELVCSHVGSAGDPYSTFETGAFALANACAASVLAWAQPQVTGTWGAVQLVEPKSFAPKEGLDDAGNLGCSVTLTLAVVARLT